jgi:hypothetical protein
MLGSSDSREGPVVDTCEHSNGPLGSITSGELFELLGDFSQMSLLHAVNSKKIRHR